MFALWYGDIFYRLYRDRTRNWLNNKSPNDTTEESPAKPEVSLSSSIPIAISRVVQSPRTPFIPTANSSPKIQDQHEGIKISEPVKFPELPKASEPVKLEPPPKTPRSPSPHPLKTDTFEEIEYDEEEEEGSSEGDEEEDSVISSSPSSRKSQLDSTYVISR